MAILTLTSDWGMRDHYLASFKGLLLSRIPDIQFVDISHDIEDYNTIEAAYIVQNTFDKFPVGSIHFIAVSNSENCTNPNPYVVIRFKGHYLIGEDNGMFNMIIGDAEKEIIRLPLPGKISRKELHESFSDVISDLMKGSFEDLGQKEQSIVHSFIPKPMVDSRSIRGSIIFVDSFGNAILNVTRSIFERERKDRRFSIQFRRSHYDLSEISCSYSDVEVGEIVAFFNQDDFLEIAINKESAAQLLGLKLMDSVRIEFNDSSAG